MWVEVTTKRAITQSYHCLSNSPNTEREPALTHQPHPGKGPLSFGFGRGWKPLGQSCLLGR